jgi:hypothetical protein
MTAGTHHIDHPAHRHAHRTQRLMAMVTAATRRPRTAVRVGSHGGQLGPLRESEIGRRSGARI